MPHIRECCGFAAPAAEVRGPASVPVRTAAAPHGWGNPEARRNERTPHPARAGCFQYLSLPPSSSGTPLWDEGALATAGGASYAF